MSVADHHARAHAHVPCAVVTISDTRTWDTDVSGRVAVALLADAGHQATRRLVPDDIEAVTQAVRDALDLDNARVVITTGGTGITRRDSSYEAIAGLIQTPLPGFGEIFRLLSFEEIGSAAMLSRATAGLIGRSAVFVLPGSEAAVRLAMTRLIVPEVGHIAHELMR